MSVANASAEHLCRKMKLDNTQTKHTFHLLPVDIQRMIVVMAGYLVSTRSDSLNCGCSLTEAAFGKTFASNRLSAGRFELVTWVSQFLVSKTQALYAPMYCLRLLCAPTACCAL
eukprot:12673-Heterococcus_DN1.PRE.1